MYLNSVVYANIAHLLTNTHSYAILTYRIYIYIYIIFFLGFKLLFLQEPGLEHFSLTFAMCHV